MTTNVPPSVFQVQGRAIDPKVVSSIRQASDKTGVDFAYLMAKASLESNFKADVKASSSSATGLYQFIEQTWLSMFKDYGDKYGQGALAAQIKQGADGRLTVADPAVRRQILDLRKDPQICASLGAEYAALNEDDLEGALGREANPTDLYVAHFMGSGGAIKFLKAVARQPNANAAELFPSAASANRSVFYDPGGKPRSVSQLYQWFGNKIGTEMAKFGDSIEAAWSGTAAAGLGSAAATGQDGSATSVGRTFANTVGVALAAPVLAPMTVVALASLSIPESAAPAKADAKQVAAASTQQPRSRLIAGNLDGR